MTARQPVLLMALFAMIVLDVGWAGGQEVRSGADGNPAVIAVKFHADWCGSCKAMGSSFEELQAKFDTRPVLFITLDHTREFNRRQSSYLARSLGLGEVWAEYGNTTGFVLLIDGTTREIISKLTHEQNLKEMGASLLAAVEEASQTGMD